MRLVNLCSLHTGYTARGRLEPVATGGALAIQLRDIGPDAEVGVEGLSRFELGDLAERHLVSAGDVVFRSRGAPNVAAVIGPLSEPVAAVLPLIILRPRASIVLPNYLAWAINQPEAQRHFDAAAQGTGIRMISKASLADVDLPLPDLETQRRIVEVSRLARHEASLLHRLADRRSQLSTLILADRARSADAQGLAKGRQQ